MPEFSEGLVQILRQIIGILGTIWWIVLPVILAVVLVKVWLSYIRGKYVAELDWILLQLTIPQEIVKTPLAMEQVFAILHSIQSKGSWWDRYVKGKVQEWFSFEIRSVGGRIFFYIYTPRKHRKLVESSIHAQYSEAEIQEVDDYVWDVPVSVPDEDYDLAGAEFILAKEDAYPIRTYNDFKFEVEEGKREANVDPLAGLIEALARLGEGEEFWLQIGIRPADDSWKKEGEKLIDELMGVKKEGGKNKSVLMEILATETKGYIKGIPEAPFRVPEFDTAAPEEKKESPPKQLSPGKRDTIELVEKNISKVGFDTTVRAIYLARKEVFDRQTFGTVTGALRQFSTQNLNAFKSNSSASTSAKWPLKELKVRHRKRKLLYKYQHRGKPDKSFVFNTEELATVFHFPSRVVTVPALPRLETRKSEPPPGLPTYP